jgi:hypothetical protein
MQLELLTGKRRKMDYIGLTEDEMLDALIEAEGEMEAEKSRLLKRFRNLGMREEEVEKRMRHFESTYLIRKMIAENNRRIAMGIDEEFDIRKKDIFI